MLRRPSTEQSCGFANSTSQKKGMEWCSERWQRHDYWGVLATKLKANLYKNLLPSIFLSSIHSLEDKMDLLQDENMTETYLNSSILDDAVSIKGLATFLCRQDRHT